MSQESVTLSQTGLTLWSHLTLVNVSPWSMCPDKGPNIELGVAQHTGLAMQVPGEMPWQSCMCSCLRLTEAACAAARMAAQTTATVAATAKTTQERCTALIEFQA